MNDERTKAVKYLVPRNATFLRDGRFESNGLLNDGHRQVYDCRLKEKRSDGFITRLQRHLLSGKL